MSQVKVTGSGKRRGIDVDGLPLLDGSTGELALFDKDKVHGALYGQKNDVWRVMLAMGDERRLKCVN